RLRPLAGRASARPPKPRRYAEKRQVRDPCETATASRARIVPADPADPSRKSGKALLRCGRGGSSGSGFVVVGAHPVVEVVAVDGDAAAGSLLGVGDFAVVDELADALWWAAEVLRGCVDVHPFRPVVAALGA